MEDITLKYRTGSAEIAGQIRREIRDGSLAANDCLPPERELAQTYGVARGTVRNALLQLAEEGLVDIRRGSGTYVRTEPDEPTNLAIANARPLELIDARFALEPHICRLAVLHARPQDFERADELIATMERKPLDPTRFAVADTEFHNLLAEATGNLLLTWIIRQVSQVRNQEQWSQMRNLTLNAEIIETYNRQHRQVLDAIKSREAEKAANLMKEHLETARLSLTRAVET